MENGEFSEAADAHLAIQLCHGRNLLSKIISTALNMDLISWTSFWKAGFDKSKNVYMLQM
jgi:hypothetical protein